MYPLKGASKQRGNKQNPQWLPQNAGIVGLMVYGFLTGTATRKYINMHRAEDISTKSKYILQTNLSKW